jgi:AcrR family transcriptional regulator
MPAKDKKEIILKSVLNLVNNVGFYHLNMKMVAAEAGVAAGTFYLYFKSKEDVINELYKLIVTEFNNHVLEAYNETDSLKAVFVNMLDKAVKFYLHHKNYFSFVEQYTYAPFLFKENQEQNFMLLLPIYKMMRSGKHKKEIKNLPDAILLSIIHGSMNTMLKMHFAKKTDLSKKAVQNKFYEACWECVAITTTTKEQSKKGTTKK